MLFDDVVQKHKTLFDDELKERKFTEEDIKEAQFQFSIYIFILVTKILFTLLTPAEKKYFESIRPLDQSKMNEAIIALFTKYPDLKNRLNSNEAVQKADEDLSIYLKKIFSS